MPLTQKFIDKEGLLSRVSKYNEINGEEKDVDTLFDELWFLDQACMDFDKALEEACLNEIPSICYMSKGKKITQLQSDIKVLAEFPQGYIEELEEADRRFESDVKQAALERLNVITISDVSIKTGMNTLSDENVTTFSNVVCSLRNRLESEDGITKTETVNNPSKFYLCSPDDRQNADDITIVACDYLREKGYSKDEIEYICNNRPEIISALYSTIHWGTDSTVMVMKNIQGFININDPGKIKVKYHFLFKKFSDELHMSEEESMDFIRRLRRNNKLGSLWATYNYSSNDYNVLLENVILNDLESSNHKETKIEVIDLSDVKVYKYCATEKSGDIVTNLEDEKYVLMLEERSKLTLHCWPSWLTTNGLLGLANYFEHVGIKNKIEEDKLTVTDTKYNCYGMEIYDQNGYLVDQNGRYLITVGPKVLRPDYDVDSEDFDICDFAEFIGSKVDVVLVNDKDSEELVTLECTYGGEIKAHTGGWGEGICMSGIRYDNAVDAGNKYETPDGSFIEFFAIPKDTALMSGYSVKKIIVRR